MGNSESARLCLARHLAMPVGSSNYVFVHQTQQLELDVWVLSVISQTLSPFGR